MNEGWVVRWTKESLSRYDQADANWSGFLFSDELISRVLESVEDASLVEVHSRALELDNVTFQKKVSSYREAREFVDWIVHGKEDHQGALEITIYSTSDHLRLIAFEAAREALKPRNT